MMFHCMCPCPPSPVALPMLDRLIRAMANAQHVILAYCRGHVWEELRKLVLEDVLVEDHKRVTMHEVYRKMSNLCNKLESGSLRSLL